MLATRELNHWLGTHYTLEEVAEMDPLLFDMMAALRRGLIPPKAKGKPKGKLDAGSS